VRYRARNEGSGLVKGEEGEEEWVRRERAKDEGTEGGFEFLSRLIPNMTEKRLAARMGDMHRYPQFSEK